MSPSKSKKMKYDSTMNLHVNTIRPLIPPAYLLEQLPATPDITNTVNFGREGIQDILHGVSDRILVVVGPCSIHSVSAAKEYAKKLKEQADLLKDDLHIVMRTYFEKPRTTVGWKGLINDPDLNQSFNINKGLNIARQLLLDINAMDLPVALEFLDTISPQFTADLIAWGAIGARTTESQLHRELTSGLSMPVGFKNGTSGNLKIAVDAVIAASCAHNFLGVTDQGLAGIVSTKGNADCHVILRGGEKGPNYQIENINKTVELLQAAKQEPKVMIDCSHGNSQKVYQKQLEVASYLSKLLEEGNQNIMGVMLESNLVEGNQSLGSDPTKLVYGKSITDACISWEATVGVLNQLAAAVRSRRKLSSK